MPKWQFSMHYMEGDTPRWTWALVMDDGSVMNRSAASFGSLEDCVADARAGGYPQSGETGRPPD